MSEARQRIQRLFNVAALMRNADNTQMHMIAIRDADRAAEKTNIVALERASSSYRT